jgi:hypothetical protein
MGAPYGCPKRTDATRYDYLPSRLVPWLTSADSSAPRSSTGARRSGQGELTLVVVRPDCSAGGALGRLKLVERTMDLFTRSL